ncbi:hypothetical protein OROMI_003521 [Orobanche minor]
MNNPSPGSLNLGITSCGTPGLGDGGGSRLKGAGPAVMAERAGCGSVRRFWAAAMGGSNCCSNRWFATAAFPASFNWDEVGHLQKIGKTMMAPMARRVGSNVGLTTSTDWSMLWGRGGVDSGLRSCSGWRCCWDGIS